MKQTILLLAFISIHFFHTQAQHVKVRMNFPSGVSVFAPGPPPFRGACWIEPEWRWVGNRYDYVAGYWAKPHKKHHRWHKGRWRQTRKGFIWVPGRWN